MEAGPGVNWWRQLWAGSPGGPGVWVPCLGVQGGVVAQECRVKHGVG